MKNKLIPAGLIAIILFFAAAAAAHVWQKNKTVANPETNTAENSGKTSAAGTNYILFYGDTCPHCAIVEAFIKEHDVSSKLSIQNKEVYNNASNAAELAQAVKSCGLATDSIGVPFLYDGSQCLIGDEPIINLFKQKLNIQ